MRIFFQNFYFFSTPLVKGRSIRFLTWSPKCLSENFAKKVAHPWLCILNRLTHNLHTRPVYRTLVGAAQCGTKMGIIQTIFDEFPQNFICESTEYPGGQTNELRQFMVTTGVTNRCQTNASCTQVHQRPVYRTGHKILLEHRNVPFIIFLVFLGT